MIPGQGWRKSEHSESSNCIEISANPSKSIAVRDSKNIRGPELAFSSREWIRFLDLIKTK